MKTAAYLPRRPRGTADRKDPGRRQLHTFLIIAVTVLAFGISIEQGFATWSIIITDPETKEVAIGSATCLEDFDLLEKLPVVIVGTGGGCVQGWVDTNENKRWRIAVWLYRGVDPQVMIERLSELDGLFDWRQYGIVDTQGRAATATGSRTSDWAGGLTGQSGSLVYSIQGNILVDSTVVYEAEQAIINTPGDIAEKLMAAMEAARDRGGDVRCAPFGKSAHVGFMLLARPGDIDGTCGQHNGCANGDYLMSLNVPFQVIEDPDPVDQLRDLFDGWRLDLIGRPDAVQSVVEFNVESIPPNAGSSAVMTVTLRDWQGEPITSDIDSLTIEQAEDSDRMTVVRNLTDLGGGRYRARVWGLESEGTDRYVITAYDGIRPVQLVPHPTMRVEVPPGGFEIYPPTPGIAGVENSLCISGGTPGETVFFIFGRARGVVPTPCGPIAIEDWQFGGQATVDENGDACISHVVGDHLSGTRVRFQAIQVSDCSRSNVVVHKFE